MSIDLKIEFRFNSSELTDSSIRQLNELLSGFANPRLELFGFSIVGHTDALGDNLYNMKLSLERAYAVREYLTEKGVAATRLDVSGNGETELLYPHRPVDPGNRRVEIINRGTPQRRK